MYLSNNPVFTANPNLEPETIQTVEASIGLKPNQYLSMRLTWFYSDIEDIIDVVEGATLIQNLDGMQWIFSMS